MDTNYPLVSMISIDVICGCLHRSGQLATFSESSCTMACKVKVKYSRQPCLQSRLSITRGHVILAVVIFTTLSLPIYKSSHLVCKDLTTWEGTSNSCSTTWWRHQMETFPRYWPFVRGIHRSPVNSLHKDQWRGALMFSLIWIWIKGWVKNREAGDLRRYRTHYDVTVMKRPMTLL